MGLFLQIVPTPIVITITITDYGILYSKNMICQLFLFQNYMSDNWTSPIFTHSVNYWYRKNKLIYYQLLIKVSAYLVLVKYLWMGFPHFLLCYYIYIYNYWSTWTKKNSPTDIHQLKPHNQISMLNKTLYSFLWVQGLLFLSAAPKPCRMVVAPASANFNAVLGLCSLISSSINGSNLIP